MTIDLWFPTAVYTEYLNPSDEVRQEMLDYVEEFIKSNESMYSITGDTVNAFQISKEKEFTWLNKEIAKHCYKYLKEFGININTLDLFASKSWPVVCDPTQRTATDVNTIEKHNHPNSHLSVIFYLQTDPNENTGGELKLHASPTHPIRYIPLAPHLEEQLYLSYDSGEYDPVTNQLIIFPSSVEHEVNLYRGSINRYSITYDIIVTGKANLEMDNEMCIINPDQWIPLSCQS